MSKTKASKLDFLNADIYTGLIEPLPKTSAELANVQNPQVNWLANDSTLGEIVRYTGTKWAPFAGGSAGSGWEALVGS